MISNALDASMKAKIAEYKETAETYIVGQIGEGVEEKNINFGREGDEGIEKVITEIDDFYKQRMIIMQGKLYYCYLADKGETAEDDIPKCCTKLGIPVIKHGDFIFDGEKSKFACVSTADGSSEYYICTPDLSGFNPDVTYYVSYEDITNVNTLKILNKINEVYTYTNAWYDYTVKNWANVLTINDKIMTYWVWVPRFAYNTAEFKIEDGQVVSLLDEEKDLDVRLISMDNKYYDEVSGTMKDLEEGWIVPDAFNFDGEARGGYWMSKYEVQEHSGNNGAFYICASTDTISVRAVDSTNHESYTVYVDGETNVAFKGKLDGSDIGSNFTKVNGKSVEEGTSYLITIYDSYGVRQWTQTVNTLTSQEPEEIKENVTVDVSTFWNNPTLASKSYFVLYDANGKNPVLVPFSGSGSWSKTAVDSYLQSKATGNSKYWYNYGDKGKSIAKIWANVATVNNDTITYWTYVPRYAFYQVGGNESWAIDVRFIKKETTNDNLPSAGLSTNITEYTVPDAFKFDTEELNGYWMSKYEVQVNEAHTDYYAVVDGNNIKIMNLYTNAETTPGDTFSVEIRDSAGTVYVDGSKQHRSSFYTADTSLTDIKKELEWNTEYDVKVYTNLRTSTGEYVKILSYSDKIKTAEKASGVENIKVDVSGFDPSNTSIVMYNGNTQKTFKLNTVMADTANLTGGSFTDGVFVSTNGKATYTSGGTTYTWFDYTNKIWANLQTTSNGTNTYWTYIPRYEIKINETNCGNTVRFIGKDATGDSEYFVPDAFTFDGKNLHGIWMSKYEVQEKKE